ncbi:MAG: hypothetical protein ACLTDX_20385 [[Clostridium] innocuum]
MRKNSGALMISTASRIGKINRWDQQIASSQRRKELVYGDLR